MEELPIPKDIPVNAQVKKVRVRTRAKKTSSSV
jgi:hypothetical protein